MKIYNLAKNPMQKFITAIITCNKEGGWCSWEDPIYDIMGVLIIPFQVKICQLVSLRALKSEMTMRVKTPYCMQFICT